MTMKPISSLFHLPEMVFGFFIFHTTCYVEGKREENSAYTANAKMPSFTKKRQAAAGKRGKWRENHGHVITFAVRVSPKLDAKSRHNAITFVNAMLTHVKFATHITVST